MTQVLVLGALAVLAAGFCWPGGPRGGAGPRLRWT